MKKRFLSLILCVALLLSLLPTVGLPTKVRAATANQNNIVARADYLFNITWLCQKTVSGWCGNYTYYSGTAYRLPYGQPINAGAYIGYGVSVDSFITATKNASSAFYTSRSTYGTTNSVYYATDCSAFVSWCWGIDRKTTYSIPLTDNVSYIAMATATNAALLQLGDCLNSNDVGHVVLVTDLTYDSNGNLTQIEITEQTPPQLKRTNYTPSELGSKYGADYGIYRYSGTVPAAPATITTKYYPACGSSYTSLYPALESIGVYCDWNLHCQIAELNGITDFSGTVAQNTQLLNLLKEGKLLNPNYTGTDSGETDNDSSGGSFVNGYENGYKGGMAGDGKIYAHGLDVSQWQGTSLDFNSIKNAGYDYVILRAGTSYGKDTCFESYYTKARAAGLDIGTYYYTYAMSVSEAESDANDMLEWIAGKTFEYPVYFDYEDPSQESLSTTTAKNICLTFCDAMAEAGYLAGVYTGYYKSTQLPISEICAKYEVWIANYWDYTYETLSPSYSTKYGMYQYTNRNYIGNNGPYDGDVAFKDYPSIVKQYGFNGYGNPEAYLEKCTVYPSYCKLTTTKSTPLNTLPCSVDTPNGSRTLVTAEAGQTYTAKALYLNTSGNYWYQITLGTGETAYLYSGHASLVDSIGTDITVSNAAAPGSLDKGDSFDVSGKVMSSLNLLDEVEVGIYTGSGILGSAIASTTVSATNNTCDLTGASLDFTVLEAGSYFYNITAKYSGYYATSAKEATTYSGEVSVMHSEFTVNDGEHSFTTKVIRAATCTTDGILERTCSECGLVERSVIVALGHLYIPTSVSPTCTESGGTRFTCQDCGDSYLSDAVPALGHQYMTTSVSPTCTEAGGTRFTCQTCGDSYIGDTVPALGHSYNGGSCTICGAEAPSVQSKYTYYLVGFINGSDYGCEVDWENMGEYKFENGKLTVIFDQDSYVFLKTEDNINWLMTQSYCTDTTAVFYNTITGTAEKMFVPGNVQVTFTLTENADESVTLSYTSNVLKPTLTLKAPTLDFKDTVRINAFYTAENIQNVVEMGMITYKNKVTTWSVDTADYVIPGANYDESSGRYYSSSQGIHAKYLADTFYLAVYAKLSDGSYVYSKLAPYSPITYANSQLKNSTDANLKQLVVAMLSYGTEAQLYFDHNTQNLANASLTDEQKALTRPYSASMLNSVVQAGSSKVGIFTNSGGFSKRTPAVSFEGAFCINYFFTPSNVPDGKMKMFYWTQEDYESAAMLTSKNATGVIIMEPDDSGVYRAAVVGIAARKMDSAVYIAAGYTSNGVSYCTGVLGYSIGTYCTSQASKGGDIAGLAKATAVYGYHAKRYFG